LIPTGIILLPEGIVLFPDGIASLPTGITPIPPERLCFQLELLQFRLEQACFRRELTRFQPDNGSSLWKRCSSGGKIFQLAWNQPLMIFADGAGAGGLEVLCWRTRLRMVWSFFGFGGVFAEHAHHGINHAAGVSIGVAGGGVQLGGLVLVVHFNLLLFGREGVDRAELPLQARDMRCDIEILCRQCRLIVGVLHIADDF